MPEPYEAGAIRSRAELDRDPFLVGIRECITEGRKLANERFTATAAVDTVEARRELARLQLQMRRLGEEGVDVNVRADVDRAIADLALLRAEMRRVNDEQVRVGDTSTRTTRTVSRNARESGKDFNLMRVAIEQLGPPLVPIAGGLLALTSAAVGLGTAGILAFKGVKAEMKDGTPVGLQYAAGVRTVKAELTALERTAAGGVVTGFQQAISKANAEFPGFNTEVAQSSKLLGDITQHLVGGLIGGFRTFNPLIQQSEGYLDHLAARFEAWATGPGGAKFAATLSTDLAHLEPALAALGTTVSHVLSAMQGPGLGALDTITALSTAINHIPVGVLTAAASAYLAYRTAVLLTKPFDLAAAALTRLTVAEEREAAAGAGAGAAGAARTGALARTAGGLAAVARAAPAVIGVAVALRAGDAATRSWTHSTNIWAAATNSAFHNASKLFSLHPWDAVTGVRNDANAFQAAGQSRASAQAEINATLGIGSMSKGESARAVYGKDQGASVAVTTANFARQQTVAASLRREWTLGAATMSRLTKEQTALAAAGQKGTAQYRDNATQLDAVTKRTAAAAAGYQKLQAGLKAYTLNLEVNKAATVALTAVEDRQRDAYMAANSARFGRAEANTFALNPGVMQGIGGLQEYAKSVAAAQKAEESWTKVTDNNTVKIHGVTYETKAWNAAVDAAGGNTAKAIGLLEGHTRALAQDTVLAEQAAAMQQRLTGDLGAAATKYQLTDAQLTTYAQVLGITSEELAKGTISQDRFVVAVGAVKAVVDNGNTAMQGWVAAVQAFSTAGNTAASRGQLMGAAMVALNGDAISYAQAMVGAASANQQFVTDMAAVKAGVVNLKTGVIDYHNAGAAPLISDLAAMQSAASAAASATYQHEVSIRGAKNAAKDATAVYYNDTRNALINEADQLGLTHTQAKKLADQYFHWPKDAKTQIAALGAEDTNTILNKIGALLAKISGQDWNTTLNVDANISPAALRAANLLANLPGSVSYQLNEKMSDPRYSNNAAGNIYTSYAVGGWGSTEHHVPQIASPKAGRVRVWAEPETKGEAYIPLADDWRRPRAQSIAQETVKRLGGVAYFAAGGGPGGGEGGGFTGVTTGSGSSGSGSGGSGSGKRKTTNEDRVYSFLHGKGASDREAAGIMGNFKTESNFNPKAYNAREQAIGLAQWEGSRRAALQRFAKARGSRETDLQTQLEFFWREYRGYRDNIADKGSAAHIAAAFDAQYERSSGAARAERMANATNVYGRIRAGGLQASASSNASASSAATAKRRAQTLLDQAGIEYGGFNTKKELDKLAASSSGYIKSFVAKIAATVNGANTAKLAPSWLVKKFTSDNALLTKELAARDKLLTAQKAADAKVATDLSNIKSERANVASTILGGFDIGTSGNGYAVGISSSLQTQLAAAKKFELLRNKAKALGLDPRLIQQLTEEGPVTGGANLEAIVNAGKGYVAGINSDYAQLNAVAQRVGQSEGSDLYGKQLAADQEADRKARAAVIAATNQVNDTLKDIRYDVHTLDRKIAEAMRQKGKK